MRITDIVQQCYYSIENIIIWILARILDGCWEVSHYSSRKRGVVFPSHVFALCISTMLKVQLTFMPKAINIWTKQLWEGLAQWQSNTGKKLGLQFLYHQELTRWVLCTSFKGNVAWSFFKKTKGAVKLACRKLVKLLMDSDAFESRTGLKAVALP